MIVDRIDDLEVGDNDAVEDRLYEEELLEINYAKLQEILQEIPVEDKMILLMKYQEDMSIKEIAKVLDVKLSTVKMRLHRAKKKVIELHS